MINEARRLTIEPPDPAPDVGLETQETRDGAYEPATYAVVERPDGSFSVPVNADRYIPEKFILGWLPQMEAPTELFHPDEGYGYGIDLPAQISFSENGPEYRLRDIIGHGGMGTVAMADSREAGKEIAIKFAFAPSVAVKRSVDRRMAREIGLMAALHPSKEDQPNLAEHIKLNYSGTRETGPIEGMPAFVGATYWEDEDGDRVYALAMEKVEGVSLHEFVRERHISAETAMKMIQPVADVLFNMHLRGLIHRDVKPANIIGDPENPESTRLIDVGIGKDLYQEQVATEKLENKITKDGAPVDQPVRLPDAVTNQEFLLGTPFYVDLAAEQGRADYHSDIYALCLSFLDLVGLSVSRHYDGIEACLRQYHRGMFDQGEERFYLPPPIDGQEFTRACSSPEERDFALLLYDGLKPVLPEGLWDFREAVREADEFTDYDVMRYIDGLRVDTDHLREIDGGSGLLIEQAEMVAELERIIQIARKEPTDVKSIIEQYFKTFAPDDLEQQGMTAFVRRLDQIIARVNNEQIVE